MSEAQLRSKRDQTDLREHSEFVRLTAALRDLVAALRNDLETYHRGRLLEYVDEDDRRTRIAKEIYAIGRDLDEPYTPPDLEQVGPDDLKRQLNAPMGSLLHQAVSVYAYRVAYFTLTRLLLLRSWEDAEFIPRYQWILFNGGFGEYYYGRANQDLQTVLEEAYRLGKERYRWLFTEQNNYAWYRPSESTLVDVLYGLAQFHLGYLNRDVLGQVYEEYLEIAAKKKTGQYYTPYPIVNLIWNRLGFVARNGDCYDLFQWDDGPEPRPSLIFDPATGSGGFPVEAARRLVETVKDLDDAPRLRAVKQALVEGIHGAEINAFPYHLTEINLLLQLTPVIKRLLELDPTSRRTEGRFTLGFLHQDALKLFPRSAPTLGGEMAAADEYLEVDEEHDIVALEGAKRDVYERAKELRYDYVAANPPYVGEPDNKALFRRTRARWPVRRLKKSVRNTKAGPRMVAREVTEGFWEEFYQGKMDYLYWFIELGLMKLREGGRLGFITTAYWPTADGASKLRQFILDHATLDELIDFGELKLFEHAPGQHNLVFRLTRCDNPDRRAHHRIKIVQVRQAPEGQNAAERLANLVAHIQEHIDRVSLADTEGLYRDDYIEVYWSAVQQGDLTEEAWHLMHRDDVEAVLGRLADGQGLLSDALNVHTGVSSSADRVTDETLKLLPAEVVQPGGIVSGSGIYVLSSAEKAALELSPEEEVYVRPLVFSQAIDRFHLASADDAYLLYVRDDLNLDRVPHLAAHLQRFRPILERRAEIARNAQRRSWYALTWPREPSVFEQPKLLSPYRAESNTFCYDESGVYVLKGTTLLTAKAGVRESLKYFLALLNSRVLDFWFHFKDKRKGKIREYFYKPLLSVPLHRIDFDCPDEVALHDQLVALVDDMIAAQRELAGYSRYYLGERLTRLRESDPLPPLSRQRVAAGLPPGQQRGLRYVVTEKMVKTGPGGEFVIKAANVVKALPFGGKKQVLVTARDGSVLELTGPAELMPFVAEALEGWPGRPWAEAREQVIVPRNLDVLQDQIKEIQAAVSDLRQRLSRAQDEMDRIVSDLYGLGEEDLSVIARELG